MGGKYDKIRRETERKGSLTLAGKERKTREGTLKLNRREKEKTHSVPKRKGRLPDGGRGPKRSHGDPTQKKELAERGSWLDSKKRVQRE